MPDEESESRTAPAMMGRRVAAPALSTSGSSPPASASISTNLHSSTSSPRSTSSKKHRRAKKKKKTNELIDLPMGANFSQSAELLHPPTPTSDPSTNTAQPPNAIAGPLQDSHATSNNMSLSSSSLNLGNNRLLTGFKHTTQSDNHDNSTDASSPGDSRDEAIEISSDEEMEESEGGMVVNLDESVPELTNGSSMGHEIETESEEGEITSMNEDVTYTSNQVRSADLAPSNLRLLDLSPDDLEEQLTYGFFHLDRTQVDLNRLVVCLSCMGSGHLSPDCPLLKCSHCEVNGHASALCQTKYRCTHCREVGHTSKECIKDLKVTTTPCDVCGAVSHVVQHCPQRHFANVPISGPAKLWISCCICASKSHLVGDCPDAPRDLSVEAWSLKTLDASQITNLSLQTGTRKLEKEAETRGMRPTGLTIKGRSGPHQAGVAQSSSVPDDEQGSFLQPSVSLTRKPAIQMGNYEIRRPNLPQSNAERYDRFDAPSFDSYGSNRNRGGNWYNTDSFGRRRSRSPRFDSYRPDTRRSPSPRRFDGRAQTDRFSRDAPPTNDYYHANASGLPQRPPSSSSQSMRGVPAASKTVQLPTRKGSNPNLPAKPPSKPLKSTTHTTPNTNTPSENQKPSSKGGKRKNKRGANQAISQFPDSKDELFVLDNLSAKMFDRELEEILSMQRPEQQAAPLSRHRYNLRPRKAAVPTMKPTSKKINSPAVTRGTGLVMEMRERGAESAEQDHPIEEIARDSLRPRKGTSLNNPVSKNSNDQGFLDDTAPVLDVHSIGCGSAEQNHPIEEPDERNTNQGSSSMKSLCSTKFQDKEITLALSRDIQNPVKDDGIVRSATTTSHEPFETGPLTLIPALRNLQFAEPNTQRDNDMSDDESRLPSTTGTTRVELAPNVQFVERPRPKNRPFIEKPVNGRPPSRTRKPCGHAHKGPQAMSKAWNLVDRNIPPPNGLRLSQRKSMPVVIVETGPAPPSALEGSPEQMSLVDDDRAHYTTPTELARSLITTNLGQSVEQDDCKLLREFMNIQNESRAKANFKPLELRLSGDGCLESSIITDLQISCQCQVTEHHIQAAKRWSASEAKRERNFKKQESKVKKREKKAKRAAKLKQKWNARQAMKEAEVIVISDDTDVDEMAMR